MKITISEQGRSFSNGILIAQNCWLLQSWISSRPKWICSIRKSPIVDKEIQTDYLGNRQNFRATTDKEDAYRDDYVIIATPTDYDPKPTTSTPQL
jgi:UDPglucose 6-dehydrogenase